MATWAKGSNYDNLFFQAKDIISCRHIQQLAPICFVWDSCLNYVICIYLRILVSNTISMSDDVRIHNNNTMGFTGRAGITHPSENICSNSLASGVRFAPSLFSCVVFCLSSRSFSFVNCLTFSFGHWLPIWGLQTFQVLTRFGFGLCFSLSTLCIYTLDKIQMFGVKLDLFQI